MAVKYNINRSKDASKVDLKKNLMIEFDSPIIETDMNLHNISSPTRVQTPGFDYDHEMLYQHLEPKFDRDDRFDDIYMNQIYGNFANLNILINNVVCI